MFGLAKQSDLKALGDELEWMIRTNNNLVSALAIQEEDIRELKEAVAAFKRADVVPRTEKPKRVPPDEVAAIKGLNLIGYSNQKISEASGWSDATVSSVVNNRQERFKKIPPAKADLAQAYYDAWVRKL